MDEPALIEGLTVSFAEEGARVAALRDVTLPVPAGRTLALVGESGCGKSLTARAILRILPETARVDAGAIHLGGTDVVSLPPRDPRLRALRGGTVGMIYQEPMTALSPYYTIRDQIVETVRQHGPATRREARDRAAEAMEAVGLPAERLDAYPFELSGGQRQRAMIAMALSTEPRLLIADEPTTALDVTTQARILDLLRGLQAERGMAMLFITHDLAVVSQVADAVAVMYLGEVVEHGPVAEVLRAPCHPYTRGLIASAPGAGPLRPIPGAVPRLDQRPPGCAFAPRCASAVSGLCDAGPVPAFAAGASSVRCLAHGPRGGRIDLSRRHPEAAGPEASPPGAVLLRVRGLAHHFERRRGWLSRPAEPLRAVDGVDLDLRVGETLALVGESGSGKTTLARAILGLHAPTAGTVTLDGRPISGLSERAMRPVWRDLRMVFQDPVSSLNARMTVRDIVADPIRDLPRAERLAHVDAALGQVGLDPALAGRFPHAFSGGQRQRIGIARALAPGPRILVLDEPVSALDVSVQAQVLALLSGLQARLGLAYLFVSHDLGVVERIAHRVAVMHRGRIVETGEAAALFAAPAHPYTRALLAARPVLTPPAAEAHAHAS